MIPYHPRMNFVLASGSPRRRELLEGLGLPFTVDVPHIVEQRAAGESVEAYVSRLAQEKAAVVAERHRGACVIAADTVVFMDGEVLEKPLDRQDAHSMLSRLSGRTHVVWTGVAFVHPGGRLSRLVSSEVTFAELSDEEIEWYASTREPMDKAGAYAVQGIGAMFIARIQGSYTNVVGLPLSALREMVLEAGINLTAELKISG